MVKSPPPSATDPPSHGGATAQHSEPGAGSPGSATAALSSVDKSRQGSLELDDKALERLPPHLSRTLRFALDQPEQDVPRMQLARSLEEAGPRTFVYIDNQGRVRSPVQYRAMQVMSYSLLVGILLGGSALYSYLLGPQGLIFGLVFGLAIGRNLLYTRQINRAALLSSHDRLDESELILRRLLKRRFVGRRLKALCYHNLGAVATRRGDHEQALLHLRHAISLYQAAWPKSPHLRSCQYGEIIALCNLARASEAQKRWQTLPRQTEGDYLLVKSWTTELYVAFSADEPPPADGELWERARRALRITSSSALLGLCSWAFLRAKDQDIAWHLLREAYDRLDGEPLFLIMPPLWRWMEQSRPLAGAAA